jgi:hypothetical protein
MNKLERDRYQNVVHKKPQWNQTLAAGRARTATITLFDHFYR